MIPFQVYIHMHVVGANTRTRASNPVPEGRVHPGCAMWVVSPGRAVDWYLPYEVSTCLAREDDWGLVLEGGRMGELMDGWVGGLVDW